MIAAVGKMKKAEYETWHWLPWKDRFVKILVGLTDSMRGGFVIFFNFDRASLGRADAK